MQIIKKPVPQGVRFGWIITLVSLVVTSFAIAAAIMNLEKYQPAMDNADQELEGSAQSVRHLV